MSIFSRVARQSWALEGSQCDLALGMTPESLGTRLPGSLTSLLGGLVGLINDSKGKEASIQLVSISSSSFMVTTYPNSNLTWN